MSFPEATKNIINLYGSVSTEKIKRYYHENNYEKSYFYYQNLSKLITMLTNDIDEKSGLSILSL